MNVIAFSLLLSKFTVWSIIYGGFPNKCVLFCVCSTTTAAQYYHNLQKYSKHTHADSKANKRIGFVQYVYNFPVGQSSRVRHLVDCACSVLTLAVGCSCCCNAFITYLGGSNVSRDVCSKNDWGQTKCALVPCSYVLMLSLCVLSLWQPMCATRKR